MTVRLIPQTPSAYGFPLLIKNILRNPLIYYPDREIIYRDKMKYTYVELDRRVKRLANALTALGVKQGDTVAMMDWDSHRYLECFFAVPMMGAVLHTINIRLSPEQLIYTHQPCRGRRHPGQQRIPAASGSRTGSDENREKNHSAFR